MSSCASAAQCLESHDIFAITRPSWPGADRPLGSGDTCLVECRGRGRTRPSWPADGHDAYGRGAVATAGGVRGHPHVCGDMRASTGDAGVASGVGSRVGGSGIGSGGDFCALPPRFSGPLAAVFAQNRWGLARGFGTQRHRQWTPRIVRFMASSCARPSLSKRGVDRKNKHHNHSRCGRPYPLRNEGSGGRKTPWSIF